MGDVLGAVGIGAVGPAGTIARHATVRATVRAA
jgi:hypothetical protein